MIQDFLVFCMRPGIPSTTATHYSQVSGIMPLEARVNHFETEVRGAVGLPATNMKPTGSLMQFYSNVKVRDLVHFVHQSNFMFLTE